MYFSKKITAALSLATAVVIGLSSCVKGDDPVEITSVTDIDGNAYLGRRYGAKIWMTENLKTSRYNDGSPIITGLDNTAWASNTAGAYAIYDGNVSNNSRYGKLYSWHAVNTGKLAPTGWHVATKAEWEELINFLGGSETAGGAMKSTIAVWDAPNTGATNSSGFSAHPGGWRAGTSGAYNQLGKSGYFWTSDQRNATSGEYYVLDNNLAGIAHNGATKTFGYSVRCVKD